MKSRTGFVSNSSSSSFVVSFPKKPKTAKDVLKYMFDGKEGGVGMDYYNDGLSYAQVANIVFEDIKNGNAKNGTLKTLIEYLSRRYHYYPNRGSCRVLGGETDEDGGSWTEKRGRYFGFDQKLMNEFKQSCIKEEDSDLAMREKEKQIINKSGIKFVKYAYKGCTDPYTKKPYTEEEIKAHDKYQKDMDNFRKTNPEYLAFEKERRNMWRQKWDKSDVLGKKLAKVDAKNFLKDNKGAYIFIVNYGDEDGWQGGTMEHGNIFRNVPHIVVSEH